MHTPFQTHPTLDTKRLLLRPLKLTDEQDVYSIYANPALMIPYGMTPISDKEKAPGFLRELMRCGEWGIELKATKTLIGTIGFVDYQPKHLRVEIGCVILESHHQQGYAKEALEKVVIETFKQTKTNRIEAFVFPSNKASCNLMEKAGFIKEGWLRERAIKNNEMQDYVLYAVLRRDLK